MSHSHPFGSCEGRPIFTHLPRQPAKKMVRSCTEGHPACSAAVGLGWQYCCWLLSGARPWKRTAEACCSALFTCARGPRAHSTQTKVTANLQLQRKTGDIRRKASWPGIHAYLHVNAGGQDDVEQGAVVVPGLASLLQRRLHCGVQMPVVHLLQQQMQPLAPCTDIQCELLLATQAKVISMPMHGYKAYTSPGWTSMKYCLV